MYSGETFAGGEAGVATPDTVCTNKAVGISVETNVYEPHLLAGTMAHMIGHNVGMSHDDGRKLITSFVYLCILPNLMVRLKAPTNRLDFFPLYPNVGDECVCRDWHGCIMAQSIVGLENVQPYKFSECSRNDYIELLRNSHGGCMMNKPNEVGVSAAQFISTWACPCMRK